jgi:8-amino-7-oxononanoate synthase
MNPPNLVQKLEARKDQGAYRTLRLSALSMDFCSNDYLGIAKSRMLTHDPGLSSGSTGSRLLAGNYPLLNMVEEEIAAFHQAEAALIYNSGYDANLGLLSCVPQKGDTILYDSLSHASIRDGIRLSFAQSYSFQHNDLEDLEKKLKSVFWKEDDTSRGVVSAEPGTSERRIDPAPRGSIYVVTESLFSMDGDFCPLDEIVALCTRYSAHLIIDEAHATGVVGAKGEGLVQHRGLQDACFARIHTFGKALGCHGAVILGSSLLKDYLINFSRSLIYTTALPPASAGLIRAAYGLFPGMEDQRAHLRKLAEQFQAAILPYQRIGGGASSDVERRAASDVELRASSGVEHRAASGAERRAAESSPIQAVIIPGNEAVKSVAAQLQEAGLDVRPILYPTVPKDAERLRIVLHAFNTHEEVELLVNLLRKKV